IDDELSALHLVMCSMRTRRNRFSLIGRLPPEILYGLFPSGPTRTQIKLGWITITHVCSHWRQVALSGPTLWRTIIFHLGAEWAEEMLARSKS
ncbi:hypothetical protein BJV78DRAFT_1105379, partial [Lactifluus subvellereus]